MTPFALKRAVALRHAGTLVRGTDYAIGAIARMVGYDDIYHFSKAFKAYHGRAPRHFRSNRAELSRTLGIATL